MQITAEYIIVMIIIIILYTCVLHLIRMYSPKSCPLSRFHICTLHKPMVGRCERLCHGARDILCSVSLCTSDYIIMIKDFDPNR